MSEHLTTRQVAKALQVSESSVKRWCNSGVIPTVRTVGGHRRIPLMGLTEFLEKTDRKLEHPVVARDASDNATIEPEQQQAFTDALRTGDESQCRRILTDVFASGLTLASIADEFIAYAMHVLGESWSCGDLEVYEERRGCELCSRLLYELSRLIPEAPTNAPLAMGGSPEKDIYTLPSQIVELVLREELWRTMNLGANLPLETMLAAAIKHRPRILWLSVSHIADENSFIEAYQKLSDSLPSETLLVIGGRALTDELRPKLRYTGHCDNMQQLAAFARAMHGKRHSIESSDN